MKTVLEDLLSLIPEVGTKVIYPKKREVGVSYCRILLHDTMLNDDGFTFYTKAARWQIRFEPAENRAMDTKPVWETGDQDVMVNSVKSSREVE